jgi:hypothetical protein
MGDDDTKMTQFDGGSDKKRTRSKRLKKTAFKKAVHNDSIIIVSSRAAPYTFSEDL